MPKLVIVESPAKAKTIAKYLGSNYRVEASIGHVRDLPGRAADVPEEYKGLAWASDGVNPDDDFKPIYVVPAEKRDQIRKLKAALKDADELLLATDEDREGESISWHLQDVLAPKVPVRRMVFNEITKEAIQRAAVNTREIDMPLVDAQETRRILDRLYGYRLSEVLWRKVSGARSAGRVQSVAVRMVVERERERMRFVAGSWWDLEAQLSASKSAPFSSSLISIDGKKLASGRDFDAATGKVAKADLIVLGEPDARDLANKLADAKYTVRSVTERPEVRRPAPPFMTSTLQQEGGRKLGMSAKAVMSTAQRLYEGGFITYMRTDSTTLSDSAIASARAQAAELYGTEYVPASPRRYERKVRNAQEAHEAIRPAGEVFQTPEQVKRELSTDEFRVYELIWKRTIASQMVDARVRVVQARLEAPTSDGRVTEWSASGSTIEFPGFLRAYVEGSDDPDAELADRDKVLPALSEGQSVDLVSVEAAGHSTNPPARYTEASLVKRLEEAGVGRPSTYASILGTIQDRGYVFKKGSALVPTWTAFAVTDLLEKHFTDYVDYEFTARLEDDLDAIAGKEKERVTWLRSFWFGNGSPGLKSMVSDAALEAIDPRDIGSIPLGVDADNNDVVLRVGRYGPYVQRGEDRASIPESLAPDELTIQAALEFLAAPKGDEPIGTHPENGLPIYAKTGRYGPYVQLGDADTLPEKQKPKMASLFKTMTVEHITVNDALQLLSLPRVVGVDPESGEEITAQNGRYGPYLKKGNDSRSIDNEENLLTVTIEEALVIYAQPKVFRRGGGGAAKPPLREVGIDPATEKPVVIKEGRYGAYLTDGETNATVPRGETVEGITIERASELLADKRAAGPSTGRGRAKKAAPKKAAKKAAPKKTAAKSTAKKSTAKKASAAKSTSRKATAKTVSGSSAEGPDPSDPGPTEPTEDF